MTGLDYAICAWSFFHHRHDTRPRFKHASTRHNRGQVLPVYREYTSSARYYIKLARESGFRGSIRDAIRRGER